MRPRMIVIAGPPGSGKSTLFPVSREGHDFFNADDRAAELNRDSYLAISPEIRKQVNREFEEFVAGHVKRRESFALETTLRSDITFRQAREARSEGFEVIMRYVALGDVEVNLERIRARAAAGGHSASEATLRAIHAASLRNLAPALRELDRVSVYDNSQFSSVPEVILTTRNGRLDYIAATLPIWLIQALQGTEYDIRSGSEARSSE